MFTFMVGNLRPQISPYGYSRPITVFHVPLRYFTSLDLGVILHVYILSKYGENTLDHLHQSPTHPGFRWFFSMRTQHISPSRPCNLYVYKISLQGSSCQQLGRHTSRHCRSAANKIFIYWACIYCWIQAIASSASLKNHSVAYLIQGM